MASAAANATPAPQNRTLTLYLRLIWLNLAAGSILAAFCAWLVAVVTPLRLALIITLDGHALGMSAAGILIVAAPILLWIFTRVFVRAPTALVGGALFRMFAVAIGAAVNALFFLFAGDSAVSVFVLAAAGFGVLALAQRLSPHPLPGLAAGGVFAATGLGGAYAIASVLLSTWPFITADVTAIVLMASIIALRAGGLVRTHETYAERRGWRALVNYGALYVLGLADLAPNRHPARALRPFPDSAAPPKG
jgi:FtsH-binding integral membrane protein